MAESNQGKGTFWDDNLLLNIFNLTSHHKRANEEFAASNFNIPFRDLHPFYQTGVVLREIGKVLAIVVKVATLLPWAIVQNLALITGRKNYDKIGSLFLKDRCFPVQETIEIGGAIAGVAVNILAITAAVDISSKRNGTDNEIDNPITWVSERIVGKITYQTNPRVQIECLKYLESKIALTEDLQRDVAKYAVQGAEIGAALRAFDTNAAFEKLQGLREDIFLTRFKEKVDGAVKSSLQDVQLEQAREIRAYLLEGKKPETPAQLEQDNSSTQWQEREKSGFRRGNFASVVKISANGQLEIGSI